MGVALQKSTEVAVRHEADVLAVVLAGVAEALGLRDVPDLRLGELPQRKQGPGQLALGHGGQHITLVPVPIRRFAQRPPAGRTVQDTADVVAGGNIVKAQHLGPVQQSAEFHIAVAVDAGIGRGAGKVAAGKLFQDAFLEFL